MATIKIDTFGGIIPRVHPTLLPDGCAVKAHNCRLKSGKLSPVREPSPASGMSVIMENGLSDISSAETVYLWRRGALENFLAWGGRVHCAPSNIADDSYHRLFVTGDTGYKGGEPMVYIQKGISNIVRMPLVKTAPPPPVVTVAGDQNPNDIRYTFYYQSYVDEYGYESPVSDASSEVEYSDGQLVSIAEVLNPPDWAVARRIYKVVAGSESESIRFIAEWKKEASGYFTPKTITRKDELAGEVIPNIIAPPKDLTWMTYVAGNFYAGASASRKRTVMFSEINRPYSWPDAYMYDIREDFVGLAVSGNSVFVATTGLPSVISGTAPESMSVSLLASPQGCVSPKSICVSDGAVFYASQDGVCMWSEGSAGVTVITEKYFSKDDWNDLNPSSCMMEVYDSALICWFKRKTGEQVGYILDLREGLAAITTHDERAVAICKDVVTDGLYFVKGRA